MSLNLITYKTMGTIFEVAPTEFTAKGYPKRYILLEIPKSMGDSQDTVIRKYVTFGDDCASLDYYNEGDFVELMFALDSFEWTKEEWSEEEKKMVKKKIHLQSDKIVDIHKRDNPFKTGEKVADHPDDLSPDIVAELATKVRDYNNDPLQSDMFKQKEGNLENDGLPF